MATLHDLAQLTYSPIELPLSLFFFSHHSDDVTSPENPAEDVTSQVRSLSLEAAAPDVAPQRRQPAQPAQTAPVTHAVPILTGKTLDTVYTLVFIHFLQ